MIGNGFARNFFLSMININCKYNNVYMLYCDRCDIINI